MNIESDTTYLVLYWTKHTLRYNQWRDPCDVLVWHEGTILRSIRLFHKCDIETRPHQSVHEDLALRELSIVEEVGQRYHVVGNIPYL